jgi:hypothetical protein
VPRSPFPTESILGHSLSSIIQDILEDFGLESKNLVAMGDDNVGHSIVEAEVVKTQPKPLSPI